ncbi:MAG: nuclear transport factor 2 family protein [Granulosicoccus sp.]
MKRVTLLLVLLMVPFASWANELTKKNKELVTNFYNEVVLNAGYEKLDTFVGETYIQHNPDIADGKEALRDLLKSLVPEVKSGGPLGEIVRVIAEENMVALHVKFYSWPGENGGAVMDIFRVEDGKIIEHWDVVQAIPDTFANSNGMF